MGRVRGFKLGKRLVKVFRRVSRRRRYSRLASLQASKTSTERPKQQSSSFSKLESFCNLAGLIKSKAKSLCSSKPGSGYIPVGAEPDKREAVPKGHLAVYVGQKDGKGESRRVLVPVIYFNHPLFGELLREAEEEYGYEHEGGITLPCQISEFHQVQTTIERGRRSMTWKKHHHG